MEEGELEKDNQKAQVPSCQISKFKGCNEQHDKYN